MTEHDAPELLIGPRDPWRVTVQGPGIMLRGTVDGYRPLVMLTDALAILDHLSVSASPLEPLLSIADAARIAGRSEKAMRQLRSRRLAGEDAGPRFRKIGGRVMIAPADLQEWIDGDREPPPPPPPPVPPPPPNDPLLLTAWKERD